MSADDVQIILYRLEELEKKIDLIHEQVRRTNGRVTDLEMKEAKLEGIEEGKAGPRLILMSVISGSVLAGVIWFVQSAI